MIDVHCHLEQEAFGKDLDEVVQKCKTAGLKAAVTSCANPEHFEKTLQMSSMYAGFVFSSVGLHPEYIKEFSQKTVDDYLEIIKQNRNKIIAVGEVGLDFYWIKEIEWQEKQKEQFADLIRFSKEIKKPLVIHCRDANEETIKILEQEDAKNVLLHMFGGKDFIQRVVENKWIISMNYLVSRSKSYKKIARDIPIENLTLETDAPWNGVQKPIDIITKEDIVFKKHEDLKIASLRCDPTVIKLTAEKIAEIKQLPFEVVWKSCGENAIKFFNLNI